MYNSIIKIMGFKIMEKIVSIAGYMLTQALDSINRTKILNPFLIALKENNEEFKFIPKGLSLEQTIPKTVDMFEENEQNAKSAAIVYPAELENIDGSRDSVIIAMAQDYINQEYIIISQPYKFTNNCLKVSKFELLEYSPFIVEKLDKLEECFAKGALSYDDAKHIWSERFRE